MIGLNGHHWHKKLEHFSPTTTEYPFDAQPRLIREAAECACVRHQRSPALYATVADAAASLAVQGLAVLRLPDGSIVPLSLYFAIIAKSSMGKGRAYKTFIRPFVDADKTISAQYDKAVAEYAQKLEDWKEEYRNIKKLRTKLKNKGEPYDHVQSELNLLLKAKPVEPRMRSWLFSDMTKAAFINRIAGINESVALAGHEASKLFGYLAQVLGDLCALSDDGHTDTHRIGTGTTSVFDACVMMLILAQPDVFYDFCAGPGSKAYGMGLWARCLFTAPHKPKGTLTSGENLDATTVPLDAFLVRIDELIAERIRRIEAGITEPDIIELDTDAEYCWVKFESEMQFRTLDPVEGNEPDRNDQTGICYKQGDLCDIDDFASKAPMHAARLAAVFAYFCGDTKVTQDMMERAIRIIRYHLDAYRDQFSLANAVPQVALNAVKLETYFRRLYLETRGTIVTLDSLHHSNTSSDLKLDKNLLPALIYMEQKGKIQYIRPNSGKSYVKFRNLVSMPS